MSDEKEESEISKLPFPHARVKEIIKSKIKEGTYIKKKAAIKLNNWLGEKANQIAEEASRTDKAYIDSDEIEKATSKFDDVDQLEKEKKRIVAHLNAIKEDINRLLDGLEQI